MNVFFLQKPTKKLDENNKNFQVTEHSSDGRAEDCRRIKIKKSLGRWFESACSDFFVFPFSIRAYLFRTKKANGREKTGRPIKNAKQKARAGAQ